MTKCIHQPNISSKNKDWIYSIKDIEDIFGIYFKNQTKPLFCTIFKGWGNIIYIRRLNCKTKFEYLFFNNDELVNNSEETDRQILDFIKGYSEVKTNIVIN